jgi:transcriptional regulator with XRE-family HTH domain
MPSFSIRIDDAIMICDHYGFSLEGRAMIGAPQLRGARALLGINRRELAVLANVSVQTIQRMETSEDIVRGNVESLTKLVAALHEAGIEFIAPGAISMAGGRGVRLVEAATNHRSAEMERAARAA